jgi:hypothetical protein
VERTEPERVIPLSSNQPPSLLFFLFFIVAYTLCNAYYASSLVSCLHDANNLLTNIVIGFDYVVSLQCFEFGG